ncbi:MAG: hypothetical protein KKD39_00190 [Candidatus Altiarchaeota archaeon]|nr:hypothetical protein [Candidatus Altiarchaeota archaeon]
MLWRVFAVLLVCGCLSNEVVRERFICPDQSIVDNPGDCDFSSVKSGECVCPQEEIDEPEITSLSETVENTSVAHCPPGFRYLASRQSNLFHVCGCFRANRIKPENAIYFKDEVEAIMSGRKPASCFNS